MKLRSRQMTKTKPRQFDWRGFVLDKALGLTANRGLEDLFP